MNNWKAKGHEWPDSVGLGFLVAVFLPLYFGTPLLSGWYTAKGLWNSLKWIFGPVYWPVGSALVGCVALGWGMWMVARMIHQTFLRRYQSLTTQESVFLLVLGVSIYFGVWNEGVGEFLETGWSFQKGPEGLWVGESGHFQWEPSLMGRTFIFLSTFLIATRVMYRGIACLVENHHDLLEPRSKIVKSREGGIQA